MKKIYELIGANTIKEIGKEICEGCKEEVTLKEIPIIGGADKGKLQIFRFGCKCEDLKNAREAIEARERAKKQHAIDMFELNSLINAKLKKSTFKTYQPKNDSQEKALVWAVDYCKNFDPELSPSVLFTGHYGVGKSHLAVSIIKYLNNRGTTAIFTSVPKLFTKIKSSFKDDKVTEQQMLEALEAVDLLVLDDLGAEQGTQWQTTKFFEIVDARAGKPTIYTTNHSLESLEKHCGTRNFERLDDLKVIMFEGKSHRRKEM